VEATHFAQLVNPKPKAKTARQQLKFSVLTWAEAEAGAKVEGTLELFECDRSGEATASGEADRLIARFDVTLAKNPKAKKEGEPKVSIVASNWQREESSFPLEWAKKTKTAKFISGKETNRWALTRQKQAAFTLLLHTLKKGKVTWAKYRLMVPDLLEGSHFEIGFRLTTKANGGEQVAQILSADTDHLVEVPALDWLQTMRAFKGRFDDEKRRPAVAAADVKGSLESKTDELLAEDDSAGVDVDGLLFERFLAEGEGRADVVDAIAKANPSLGLVSEQLGRSDIVKSYFVVHDVANRFDNENYKLDQIRRVYRKMDKKGGGSRWKIRSVHGFLNPDGTYSPTVDFVASRSGAVFDGGSVKKGARFNGYCIHVETVPRFAKAEGYLKGEALETFLAPHRKAMKDEGGWMGWKHQPDSKKKYTDALMYTKALLDTLADLYIMASARAGHLLTVSAHKELDRNLCWDVWIPEIQADIQKAEAKREKAEKAGKTADVKKLDNWLAILARKEKKAKEKAGSIHGDPRGFDFEIFYKTITEKLNARLEAKGSTPMPTTVRYGVHPKRIIKGEKNIDNVTGHAHTFPHQSNPKHVKGKKKS
jgi:hypothetical protein